MGREDWYRRSTWTSRDAEEFEARLKRARAWNRSQYLRIQALHLAEAGVYLAALALLERQSAEYPDPTFESLNRLQRGRCHDALGRIDEAVACFRAALAAEEAVPNVRSGVALAFPYFIVARRLAAYYDEALRLVDRFESEQAGTTLPADRFRCHVTRALIAWERGEAATARRFAALARAAAAETFSGFGRHPDVGLVGAIDREIDERLRGVEG